MTQHPVLSDPRSLSSLPERLNKLVRFVSGRLVVVGHTVEHDGGVWQGVCWPPRRRSGCNDSGGFLR